MAAADAVDDEQRIEADERAARTGLMRAARAAPHDRHARGWQRRRSPCRRERWWRSSALASSVAEDREHRPVALAVWDHFAPM